MLDLTAAHRSLPFGTYVMVRNLVNGRSLVVRINDRGPFVRDRIIDLSYSAARILGITEAGTMKVSLEVMKPEEAEPVYRRQLDTLRRDGPVGLLQGPVEEVLDDHVNVLSRREALAIGTVDDHVGQPRDPVLLDHGSRPVDDVDLADCDVVVGGGQLPELDVQGAARGTPVGVEIVDRVLPVDGVLLEVDPIPLRDHHDVAFRQFRCNPARRGAVSGITERGTDDHQHEGEKDLLPASLP